MKRGGMADGWEYLCVDDYLRLVNCYLYHCACCLTYAISRMTP